MRSYSPSMLLSSLLTLALTMGASSAMAPEPNLLGTCTNCWPLSSPSPGSLMAPDGAGGTYVVWLDGGLRWRLQRLRADLSIPEGWPAAGRTLASAAGGSWMHPGLLADGEGGVYVTWAEQDRSFDMSVWLIRVRSDATVARGWPEAGLRVSGPAPLAWHPALARRGDGVAVAWLEAKQSRASIGVAAFDANGRTPKGWPAEGHPIPAGDRIISDFVLFTEARSGFLVGWTDMTDRLSDLRMAHVPANGGAPRAWTLVSRAIPVHAIQMDDHPELVADGLGGAIVSWTDERHQDTVDPRHLMDVFGQRVGPSGEPSWTSAAGGHPVATGPGYQKSPHVVSDGRGGAYFSWNEHGPLAATSGRLQHLDARGRPAAGWPEAGIARGLEIASLVSDGDGGVYATWMDSTGTFLEGFPSRGDPAFPLGHVEERTNVRLAPDGRGGVFMAWEERDRIQVAGRFRSKVWIQHLDLGMRVASPMVSLPTEPPALAFAVHPIAPNPAAASCRISFDLPARTLVDVDVFDVAGRRVARPAERREFEAGPQSLEWNLADRGGRRVPAGVYLVRVKAGRDEAVARVTVTR